MYTCVPCGRDHEDSEFNGSLCTKYIMYEAKHDLIQFGRFFLSGDFAKKNKSPDFHYEIARSFISTKQRSRVCNIVARGHAKSTLAKAALLHKICFNPPDRIEFVPWICETQIQANKHIRYLREQLKYNERIHAFFPHIKIVDDTGEKKRRKTKDTEKDFETTKGDKIFAVGMNQKIRGGVHTFEAVIGEPEEMRYSGVILDDFEGEQNTITPESRQRNKDLLASTVLPALEESPGREGWVWMSGTIVHYDSFLQSVYDDWKSKNRENEERKAQADKDGTNYEATPQVWDLRFYAATHNRRLDDDSIALWPDRFSLEKLRQIKREFESLGSAHKFPQEYMNDARDEASAPIRVGKIIDHNLEHRNVNGHNYLCDDKYAIPVFIYIGVDCAQATSIINDYSVIYVLAVDSQRNYYTLEIFRDRVSGLALYPKLIKIVKKYHPVNYVHIDASGGGQNIIDKYRVAEKEERKLLRGAATPAKYPKGFTKEERNTQLIAPAVNEGYWYMRPSHKNLLADELFELPFPKYDDVTDGAWLALHFAQRRFPKSGRFPIGELEKFPNRKVKRHARNWREPRGTWR